MKTKLKVEIYRRKSGQYSFRFRHKNGRVANHSYNRRRDAVRGLRALIAWAKALNLNQDPWLKYMR